nr:hypothetical protein GCM10025732_32510 [Glycomyces mayteni]
MGVVGVQRVVGADGDPAFDRPAGERVEALALGGVELEVAVADSLGVEAAVEGVVEVLDEQAPQVGGGFGDRVADADGESLAHVGGAFLGMRRPMFIGKVMPL